MSIELLKRLRDETQCGFQDCKNALVQAAGDYDKALSLVRELARADVSKMATRVAKEGLVGLHIGTDMAIVSELNCETDFVARAARFRAFLQKILELSAKTYGRYSNKDEFLDIDLLDDTTPRRLMSDEIGVLGENIVLGNLRCLDAKNSVIAYYIHNPLDDMPLLGRIASLVILKYHGKEVEKVMDFGRNVALHIASDSPLYVSIDGASDIMAQKKSEYAQQAAASGKPAAIVEKMLEGMMNKFVAENVLLEQSFLLDNKKRVTDVLHELKKSLNEDISIEGFVRIAVGGELIYA